VGPSKLPSYEDGNQSHRVFFRIVHKAISLFLRWCLKEEVTSFVGSFI